MELFSVISLLIRQTVEVFPTSPLHKVLAPYVNTIPRWGRLTKTAFLSSNVAMCEVFYQKGATLTRS